MLSRRLAKRLVLGIIAGALLAAAGACGAFFLRIHEANGAVQGLILPHHPLPGPGSALLVVAPHCDDETLGAGGLLAEAGRAGARVHVVLLTNGDGFRMATARRYRKLRPDRQTYIRFAYDRQQETLAALAELGLRPDQVTFLGYPDGGLAPMWSTYWSPDKLYTSRYTRCSASPYCNAFRPGAPYYGQSVLRDLEAVLRAFQPTEVYLPHPGDDHPDHWSTHCYGMAALERLRAEHAGYQIMGVGSWGLGLGISDKPGDSPGLQHPTPNAQRPTPNAHHPIRIGVASDRTGWALRTRVYCYLVHRGDWPVPQGRHIEARLVPPAPLLKLDTRWERLPLSPEALAAKERALAAYRSQTAVMGRFLNSFVRSDELFGSLPPREVGEWVAAGAADGTYLASWDPYLPVVADSEKDTLLRGINGSGDVTAVYAVAGPERLHLRLVTRKPLSPRITYRVRLRPVACDDPELACAPITLAFLRYRCSRPGVSYAYRRTGLEISIPLADLGHPRALFLGGDTGGPGLTIDRIAWRILRLPPPTTASPAS